MVRSRSGTQVLDTLGTEGQDRHGGSSSRSESKTRNWGTDSSESSGVRTAILEAPGALARRLPRSGRVDGAEPGGAPMECDASQRSGAQWHDDEADRVMVIRIDLSER